MIRQIFSLILISTIINSIVSQTDPIQFVVFKYKSDVVLDCDDVLFDGDLEFNRIINNVTEKITPGKTDKITHVAKNKIMINSLRFDDINAQYTCTDKDGKIIKRFGNNIHPFLYKPDKPSQTITDGSSVDFECKLLYGTPIPGHNNDDGHKIVWQWVRNKTVITNDTRYTIISTQNKTTLSIEKATDLDKGSYECTASNSYGNHTETIQLRVKDALAALWPFLAVVVEVIVLCLIILIYEKKCAKKGSSNEEDNEQTQNLMGKETQNADLKKRNAKA